MIRFDYLSESGLSVVATVRDVTDGWGGPFLQAGPSSSSSASPLPSLSFVEIADGAGVPTVPLAEAPAGSGWYAFACPGAPFLLGHRYAVSIGEQSGSIIRAAEPIRQYWCDGKQLWPGSPPAGDTVAVSGSTVSAVPELPIPDPPPAASP